MRVGRKIDIDLSMQSFKRSERKLQKGAINDEWKRAKRCNYWCNWHFLAKRNKPFRRKRYYFGERKTSSTLGHFLAELAFPPSITQQTFCSSMLPQWKIHVEEWGGCMGLAFPLLTHWMFFNVRFPSSSSNSPKRKVSFWPAFAWMWKEI